MAGSIPGGGLRFPGGAGPSASGRSPFGPPHRMVPSSLSPLKNPQGPPLLILSLSTKKKKKKGPPPLPFQVFFGRTEKGGATGPLLALLTEFPALSATKARRSAFFCRHKSSSSTFLLSVIVREKRRKSTRKRRQRHLVTGNSVFCRRLLSRRTQPEPLPSFDRLISRKWFHFFFQSMEWMETSLFSRPRCFYRPSGGWLINALIYRFHHGRWFVSPSR